MVGICYYDTKPKTKTLIHLLRFEAAAAAASVNAVLVRSLDCRPDGH